MSDINYTILNGELMVAKTIKDQNGNVVDTTYETVVHATSKYDAIEQDISDIKGGTITVDKANKDGDGNVISTTYYKRDGSTPITSDLKVTTDNTQSIGESTKAIKDLFMKGKISNGSKEINVSTLLDASDILGDNQLVFTDVVVE